MKDSEVTILDSITTQVWFLTDAEHYGRVNQAHADFWGLTRSRLEHKSIYEVLSHEKAKAFVTNNKDIFIQKKRVTTEEWWTDGKNRKRLLRVTKTPKLDDQGNVAYLVCNARDITELKELDAREAQFNSILASIDDGVLVVDEKGSIKMVNKRFSQLWRVPPELIEKGDGNALLSFVLDQLEEPEVFLEEVRAFTRSNEAAFDILCFKDGRIFECYTRPLLQDDKPQGRVWSFHDITEYKKAEKSLEQERMQFFSILDSITESIYIADPETYEILYANNTIKEAFGKDVIGGICYSEFQGRDQPCDFCTNDTIMANEGRPYRWMYHNPILEKDFILIDRMIKWPDGRDVRFELAIDITEQKRTEEALKESEEKLAITFKSIGDGVIATDREGYIVQMNPQAERLTGWSFQEAKGRHMDEIFNIISAVTGKTAENPMHKVLETGRVEGLANDTVLIARDGTKRQIADSAAPIRGIEGNIEGVVIVFSDFTEQYEMRRALRESEQKYRSIIENAFDLIALVDVEGRFIYHNQTWNDLGYTPAQLKEATIFDIVDAPDRNKLKEYFKACLPGEEAGKILVQGIPREGIHRWLECRAKPLTGEDERPQQVLFNIQDITERKLAEEAQRESEEKYRVLFESATAAILIHDRVTGEIVDANKAALKQYGYSSFEELKRGAFEEKPPFSTQDALNWIHKAARTGPQRFVWRNRRKDGGLFWEDALLDKITINGTERIMAICIDITERKHAQDQLVESKRKIEDLYASTVRMNRTTKEEEIYQLIIEAAEKILEFDICTVDIVEGDYFVVKATSAGMPEGGSQNMHITDGIAGKSFRWGETVLVNNMLAEDEAKPVKETFRSLISTPIGNVGVFQVTSPNFGAFSQEDVKLTEILISHAAEAIKRIRSETRIKQFGFYDSLTGLYSRAYLDEEFKRLDTQRQLPISIIMADINGLKLVNDAYGHHLGDILLINAAEVIKSVCRDDDIVGRWGGDEFVILLPKTTEEGAQKLCWRILHESSNVYVESLPVSMALGVACKQSMKENIYETLRAAEDSMYRNKLVESRSARSKVLSALVKALGEKSFETEKHTQRMQRICMKIGEKIGLSPEEMIRLNLLVALHDIGKITISQEILNKPGKLTEEEWEIIKTHPELGYRIARSTEEIAHVAQEILSHHERWDGGGYPQGLAGEKIPLLARIISIVDAFDVMTNGRPYKKPVTNKEAAEELKRCAGTQFDPKLVAIFLDLLKEDEELG